MLRAIAIDDEPLALEVIKSHASKVSFVDLQNTYTDAFKAIDYLQHHEIDLLFLDIKMPGKTGLEVVREVGVDEMPLTIFVTAYDAFALRAFEGAGQLRGQREDRVEGQLPGVDLARPEGELEVVVVDNGSTDGTWTAACACSISGSSSPPYARRSSRRRSSPPPRPPRPP